MKRKKSDREKMLEEILKSVRDARQNSAGYSPPEEYPEVHRYFKAQIKFLKTEISLEKMRRASLPEGVA